MRENKMLWREIKRGRKKLAVWQDEKKCFCRLTFRIKLARAGFSSRTKFTKSPKTFFLSRMMQHWKMFPRRTTRKNWEREKTDASERAKAANGKNLKQRSSNRKVAVWWRRWSLDSIEWKKAEKLITEAVVWWMILLLRGEKNRFLC